MNNDDYHGDEQEIEFLAREQEHAYIEEHADDWKGDFMTDKNIFDLTDITDCDEIKDLLQQKPKRITRAMMIDDLLKIKSPLSIYEIIVGLYRLHGIKIGKVTLTNVLFVMEKRHNHPIVKLSKGIYATKDD